MNVLWRIANNFGFISKSNGFNELTFDYTYSADVAKQENVAK